MLNGGRVENRWQPMSADRWNLPLSFSSTFIAENTGRSGQPTQKPGGRAGRPARSSAAFFFSVLIGSNALVATEEPRNAGQHDFAGVLAGERQHVLAAAP